MVIRTTIATGAILSCVALPLLASTPASKPATDVKPSIQVLFTPDKNCIKAIVNELEAATSSILVQAYILTSNKVGDALIAAKQRGVRVNVLLDREHANDNGSEAKRLSDQKINVRLDGLHRHAHNKVIIVDRSVVITGSLNFSEQAQEQNADNLLIIKGHPQLARQFHRNWRTHAQHSRPFTAETKTAATTTSMEKAIDSAPIPQPATQQNQATVYITKSGKRYHRKECQFARSGAQPLSRDEAIKKGKTPCRRCNPD